MIRAFEIQTYQGGVWQVDSVFDDEELAVFEAQSLFDRGRYVGVRVVLEAYEPDTDELSVQTILKLEKTEKNNAEARGRDAANAKEIQQGKKRVAAVKKNRKKAIATKRKKKQSRSVWTGIGLKAALVAILGLAMMIGLRALYQYL